MEGVPLRLPSPLMELDDERITKRGVRLLLKRDGHTRGHLRRSGDGPSLCYVKP